MNYPCKILPCRQGSRKPFIFVPLSVFPPLRRLPEGHHVLPFSSERLCEKGFVELTSPKVAVRSTADWIKAKDYDERLGKNGCAP